MQHTVYLFIVLWASYLWFPTYSLADEVNRLTQGKTFYRSYGCAACHGKAGDGKGLAAQKSFPPPTNFQNPNAYLHGKTKKEIMYSIKQGIRGAESVMPAFPHIPPDELEMLAEYLVSLQQKS